MTMRIGDERINAIAGSILDACIDVHREVGRPGLLESAYEECLCHELSLTGMRFERQRPLPVRCKNVLLNCGYRLDLVVEDLVVVELKTVDALLPIHDAQLLTYLKLSGLPTGLLMNFNVAARKQGIKRIVSQPNRSSAPPCLRGEP